MTRLKIKEIRNISQSAIVQKVVEAVKQEVEIIEEDFEFKPTASQLLLLKKYEQIRLRELEEKFIADEEERMRQDWLVFKQEKLPWVVFNVSIFLMGLIVLESWGII